MVDSDKYRKIYELMINNQTSNITSRYYVKSTNYQELEIPNAKQFNCILDLTKLNHSLNKLNAESDNILTKYKKMIEVMISYRNKLSKEIYYEYTKNIWVCIKMQMPLEDDISADNLNKFILTENEIAKIYETTI